MVSFENDYSAGAHPAILQRLLETNLEPTSGYGSDRFCESARQKIREACCMPEAEVEFLVGGTQTNMTVISTMLEEYEGVVAADTGHVSTHEAGAIEYSGHKVLTVPEVDGKVTAENLKNLLTKFYEDGTREHMVWPGMVYISHPTEYGTLYTKAELEAIGEICRNYEIPLFMDGARLGYGLMSEVTDVTLADIARICDVFYIGGTKVGALCGEAVVFTKGNKPSHFVNRIKKRGALLAKGRLLGVQFDTLFTGGLYYEIGRHAIAMAAEMKEMFRKKGYTFYIDSPTNQQFVVLPDEDLERIRKSVVCSIWEKLDESRTVARFVTSWATTKEDLAALEAVL